jgi:hypothetical protein
VHAGVLGASPAIPPSLERPVLRSLRSSVWLGTAALIAACGDSGLTAVDSDGARIPLRIVGELRLADSTETPETPASIEAASISGDILHLRLAYAGGCGGPHEFGLAAGSALVVSSRPQVTLLLRHDGHGDPCRAGLGHDVETDLRPLQGIAGEHRTLRLRLYEPWAVAPVEAPLLYSF